MQNPDRNSSSTPSTPSSAPFHDSDARHLAASWFERVANGLDTSRRLVSNFGKLAFLMSKGAYLVEERRRLFQELGEIYYESLSKMKSDLPTFDSETAKKIQTTVQTIERITKKIELEELLVRQFRFGYRPRRAAKT